LRVARKGREPRRGTFTGGDLEMAYMMGMRAGDLNAFRQSPACIVGRVSTTHRAMLELFQQTFAPYGQCTMAARRVFLSGFDWQIKVNLDNSFEFLVDKPISVPTERNQFYRFIAGVSDSDGCWCLFEDKRKAACAFMISSENKDLMVQLKRALEKECFHVYLYLDRSKGTTKVMRGPNETREIRLTRDSWRLDIHRREEVRALARRLMPLSRHREKILKMFLVLDESNEEWKSMGPKVRALKDEIAEHTRDTIRFAEIEYKARHPAADFGGRRLDR
jgi:hypothetical protein